MEKSIMKSLVAVAAIAASLAAAPPAFAQDAEETSENKDPAPYSKTVFFGDSGTDSGFFRPLLPLSVRPVTGQFTTNPALVWSQYLADFYDAEAQPNGNGQTGTNYSAGGARVATNSTGALGPIPSMATQLNNYLSANGGAADPNGLYVLSGGMNDIFAITNAGAPVGTTLDAAAAGLTGMVSSLSGAGARYIVVSNTPDLGLAPAFVAQGSAASANGTALSNDLSQRIFASLTDAGLRVIPIDLLTFSRELRAEAAAFGFSNVTGTACQPQITANSLTCNPTSLINPDARNTYLYADGVHYASRAHDIIAQFVASVLEAPRLVAQLPYTASLSGQMRAERVLAHTALRGEGSRGWWMDVRGDRHRPSGNDSYEGEAQAILAGADLYSGAFRLGLFAGYSTGEFEFDTANEGGNSEILLSETRTPFTPVTTIRFAWQSDRDWLYSQVRGGGYDQAEITAGGYASWQSGNAWLHAQASYTMLEFDVERVVKLAGRVSTRDVLSPFFVHSLSQQTLGGVTRVHSGSADGSVIALGLNGGWEFQTGPVRHGPVGGVLAQFVKVDGYSESNANLATALAYPDQEIDSVLGSIGWQASLAIEGTFDPYVKAVYQREFQKPAEEAFARSLTLAGTDDFGVPGITFDRDFTMVTVGLREDAGGIHINAGATVILGRGQGTDTTAFLGVSKAF